MQGGTGAVEGSVFTMSGERAIRADKAKIAILEALVAADPLSSCQCQRAMKDWSIVHAGVELTALAAGVHRVRQFRQQPVIELSTGKVGIELRRVHTAQNGPITLVHKATSEPICVASPEWKYRLPAERLEQALPVNADVGQEEIAEGEVPEVRTLQAENFERTGKGLFVELIACGSGDGGFYQWQSQHRHLGFEDTATHAVHADPIVVSGDCGQQCNDFEIGVCPERSQCQTAVLSTAPRERDWYCHDDQFTRFRWIPTAFRLTA
jgi:hypothetical protein